MIPQAQNREFVSALVDLVSQAIGLNRLDDAETLLSGVRALRPKMVELDTFDAWICLRRGQPADAVRILRASGCDGQRWPLGQALLAFCQLSMGDSAWEVNANEVLAAGESDEAMGLARLMLGQHEPAAEATQTTAASTGGTEATSAGFGDVTYMRA